MIIRSGLICNRQDVSRNEFDEHWLNVHGPLARIVPGMRAYSQNHVLEHFVTDTGHFHAIDGISQLWFDDVPAMERAMDSREQRACVEDIKGFLSAVTIVIQRESAWMQFGEGGTGRSKVMAVLTGDPAGSQAYALRLNEWLAGVAPSGGKARVNGVIERGYVVDESVARGKDIVAAIAEIWFNDPGDVRRAAQIKSVETDACTLECVAALQVQEVRILERSADAAASR